MHPIDLLKNYSQTLGIRLDEVKVEKLLKYQDLLKVWNKRFNLTAIKDDESIIIKHFIDSLYGGKIIEEKDAKLLDVGSGAGFPGMVIKIYKPEIELYLLDAHHKRIEFLQCLKEELRLTKITIIHGRAEEFGKELFFREKFDYVLSRALSPFLVSAEYCLPFVSISGYWVAMVGKMDKKIEEGLKILHLLGGELDKIINYKLPKIDAVRNLIMVKKTSLTPPRYPRRTGIPAKRPLHPNFSK